MCIVTNNCRPLQTARKKTNNFSMAGNADEICTIYFNTVTVNPVWIKSVMISNATKQSVLKRENQEKIASRPN
jgi:hypothetical protein